MFAACRAQWQRENYSLYWVLLEHKMHIKSFYALTVRFVLPDWQGAPTHWYHLSCREESSATQSMFPADALSPHTCSDAAQLATTACLPASKRLVCDHSFPFLDTLTCAAATITWHCTKPQHKRLCTLHCRHNCHPAFETSPPSSGLR